MRSICLTLTLYREEEVSSCQDQLGEFRSAASALTKWLEQTNEKVPAVQPNSSVKSLEKDLQIVSVSQDINKKSNYTYCAGTERSLPLELRFCFPLDESDRFSTD